MNYVSEETLKNQLHALSREIAQVNAIVLRTLISDPTRIAELMANIEGLTSADDDEGIATHEADYACELFAAMKGVDSLPPPAGTPE